MSKPLGRRIPEDFGHVSSYPLSALIGVPATGLVVPPAGTDKSLGLPWWWKKHDQGQEGACEGFGNSAMMSITNHYQRLKAGRDITFRYDAHWLYQQAQLIDDWADTPPLEGTSGRAACEILRSRGHKRVQNNHVGPESLANGIDAYRWATTVDEVRAAIFGGLAVAIGINWYDSFDSPTMISGERWLPQGDLGAVRGGHCVCLYRMSDYRQAFAFMNSWGPFYPSTWMPYATFERLLGEYGEAAVITDR